MRTVQTCNFDYETYETYRDGSHIPSTRASHSGTFTAIVRANGMVQSLELPDGTTPYDVNTLADLKPGASFNRDDEGAEVVVIVAQHGVWVVTQTLPG